MKLLVIHDVLPVADQSGSELRLLQVLRELTSQGHKVTYVARFATDGQQYISMLEEMGVTVWSHDLERLRFKGIDDLAEWSFEEILHQANFDLAILCTWFWFGISVPEHYMQVIRTESPRTTIAVLTDDVHFLRQVRHAKTTGLASDWERAEDYRSRECTIYRCADVVLSISAFDRKHLLANFPQLDVRLLSVVAEEYPLGPSFMQREGLMYLGDFSNPANLDAIAWFIEESWPLVRKAIADLTLHIVGRKAPINLSDCANRIVCNGHVPDLTPIFDRHRVFVAPLRFGTGVPTKNLLALSHGLPVVTTSVGSEGLELQHNQTAQVSDTPEGFAELVVRLYRDPALWTRMATAGREYVLSTFSRESLKAQVTDLLAFSCHPQASPTSSYCWSCLAVEEQYPEVLSHLPSSKRLERRCFAYLQLADKLIAAGQVAAARDQARHVFCFFERDGFARGIYGPALDTLCSCYLRLGDTKAAQRCLQNRSI